MGCWVPECAYRPEGTGIPSRAYRKGPRPVEDFLADAGFRYFFIDTHMAEAGESLGSYGDVPHGVERFDAAFVGESEAPSGSLPVAYQAYLVGEPDRRAGRGLCEGTAGLDAGLEPTTGYPGDGSYLEFHKIRWPSGLKYWSVTGSDVDLGEKVPYDPAQAGYRASDHATHFSGFLGHIQRKEEIGPSGVAMAPFDTELFGHWWFEGVDFLRELFGRLPFREGVIPVTASEHLDSFPPKVAIRPLEGSWGANGDFSMWLNEGTRWTWERLWPLEDAFWEAAPRALASEETRPILAHAARQLLLAQSSDWQFMISTGAVPDYAERRFNLHCDDAETLMDALKPRAPEGALAEALEKVLELQARDDLFPNILDSVEEVLGSELRLGAHPSCPPDTHGSFPPLGGHPWPLLSTAPG